jgi:hypothetical protein
MVRAGFALPAVCPATVHLLTVPIRRALACILLTLVPFTGIRVVCTDGTGTRPAALAEAPAADCDDFCLRRNAPAGVPAALADCLLVADGSLLLVMSGVAVLPTPPAIRIDRGVVPIDTPAAAIYRPPALARLSPPPKP